MKKAEIGAQGLAPGKIFHATPFRLLENAPVVQLHYSNDEEMTMLRRLIDDEDELQNFQILKMKLYN